MLGGVGPTELIIILVIVLIVFGAGRLPDIASGLGKGLRDFKKVMQEPDENRTDAPGGKSTKERPPQGEDG